MGYEGQLPRLVELLLQRGWADSTIDGHRSRRHCRSMRSTPGNIGADQLWRPPRPHAVRGRLLATRISGITTGPRPSNGPVCYLPFDLSGGTDLIRADIANFQAALRTTGIEGRLHDRGRAGQLRPHRQPSITRATRSHSTPAPIPCARNTAPSSTPASPCSSTTRRSPRAWDQINPAPTVGDYLQARRLLGRGPQPCPARPAAERIRFHLCWGSWHGPHTTDIADARHRRRMLEINAGAYSFEAGNVRHEHEWAVWQEVKLPDDKLILPGVVSHATNVVEHPELVADRIGASPSSSAARGSSPRPTAAWAAASTRRSPGPSSRRWHRGRSSPGSSCGSSRRRNLGAAVDSG